MGQLNRTTGQEHRVDVGSREAGLLQADVDPRLDPVGETLGVIDQISAFNADLQTFLDPAQRDARFRLL